MQTVKLCYFALSVLFERSIFANLRKYFNFFSSGLFPTSEVNIVCCVGSVEIPKSKYIKLVYCQYRIKQSLTGPSSETNMFHVHVSNLSDEGPILENFYISSTPRFIPAI